MERLKKALPFIVPPIAVMLIMGYAFYANELFPFGDGTVSWCDMAQQVVPLLTDFKDIITGKDGMFLNLHNAGGMNLWGVFFFFIASPFTLLTLFVDKTDVVYLVNIIVVLKLMTASLTSQIYFRVCQKKLSPVLSSILSVVYAFCGYGMLYYQNNIWLDMMYLFPLLMVSFHYLFEKKKIMPYVIMLTLMMVVNYYISYMIVLFILLYMAVRCYRYRKDERYKDCPALFIIGSVLGALLSAAVWIPCFLQYLSSGRSKSVYDELVRSNFFSKYQTTLCILLSTASVIVIIAVYAFDGKKRSKNLNTYLIMLFLMLVPMLIEPANIMWHTGSYMSFPCRYAFITLFLAVMCAGYFLSEDERPIKEKKKCDNYILFLVLAIMLYTFFVFSNGFVENNLEGMSKYTRSLWQDETAFVLVLELFFVAAVFYTVMVLLHKRGWISKNIFAIFLAMFVALEANANVNIYVTSADKHYPQRTYYHEQIMDLSDRIEDEDFYRVKTTNKLFEVNLIGSMGYNSLSHYTSLTSRDYMYMMKQMGYSSYWMEVGSYGGTELTDALLSVKYCIAKNDGSDCVYYNDTYEICPTDFYLPLGLVTDEGLGNSEELPAGTRSDVQKALYKKLFDPNETDELITDYDYDSITGIETPDLQSPYVFTKTGENAYIDYNINVTDKQTLYFDCFDKLSNNLTEEINNSFVITVNGLSKQSDYPSQSSNGLIKLGEFENETVNIRISLKDSVTCNSYGVFGLHHDVLQKAVDNAKSVGLKDEDGKLTGSYTAEAGEKCVLQIPYQEGLKIKVNGESVEYSKVFGDLVAFDLQEGENDITVTSSPKGFYAGLLLTIVGVGLTAAYAVFRRKLKFGELSQSAAFVIVEGLGIIVLIVIYIAPCIINMYCE